MRPVEEQIEALKRSEYGYKVAVVDAAAGRIYGWLVASGWFVLAAILVGIAAPLSSSAPGIFASLLSIGSFPLTAYAVCRGCSEVLCPRNASEIMVDELQARFKPLSWAVDFISSLHSRAEAKAGRH